MASLSILKLLNNLIKYKKKLFFEVFLSYVAIFFVICGKTFSIQSSKGDDAICIQLKISKAP